MAILPAANFPLNCGTAATGPTLSFPKSTISEESFRLDLYAQKRFLGDATSPGPTGIADRIVTRSTSPSFVEDLVAIATRQNGYFGEIEFSTSTTGTVSGSGFSDSQFTFTHVANGVGRIVATSDLGLTNSAELSISSGGSTSSDTWLEWATGSLGSHVVAGVTSRASASGVTTEPFLIKDHVQALYTRNPSCWLFDVDLSCVSPWNSASGQLRGGTLVSPEHCVFATHFGIPVNATVRFVSIIPSSNQKLTVEDRTVVGVAAAAEDIQVARLSAPVAAPYCKVAPTNLMNYVPSVTRSKANNFLAGSRPRLPLVATNQDKQFGYKPCFELSVDWITSQGILGTAEAGNFEANSATVVSYPSLVPFVRSGCSGHPLFLLVSGDLVLVGLYFSANAGTCFGSQATHDSVNAAMTTLGGGYQLEAADLSTFTEY